jgi:hypothetical protein
MYFSKGGILYLQSGRVHYWLSKGGGSTIGFQMRSSLSKCIYLHCPLFLKGGGATIALYFTEIEKK